MHEVEGGNDKWLMRILRHETGHAIDTAFGLRRRKTWRDTFGKASRRYPSRYSPRPTSRRFVLHLGHWYAQSHPTEDFAETFAVWLPRDSRWRSQYAGWPALRQARVRRRDDAQAAGQARDCASIATSSSRWPRTRARCASTTGASSAVTSSTRARTLRPAPAARLRHGRRTIRRGLHAGRFLRKVRPQVERLMIRRARMHPYLVQHVLRTATQRARRMNLRLSHSQRDTKREVLVMLERIMLDMLLRDRENYAL